MRHKRQLTRASHSRLFLNSNKFAIDQSRWRTEWPQVTFELSTSPVSRRPVRRKTTVFFHVLGKHVRQKIPFVVPFPIALNSLRHIAHEGSSGSRESPSMCPSGSHQTSRRPIRGLGRSPGELSLPPSRKEHTKAPVSEGLSLP